MSDAGAMEWLARELCKTESPPVDPDGKIPPGSGLIEVPADAIASAMSQGPRNWHTKLEQASKLLRRIQQRVAAGQMGDKGDE